MNELDIIKNLIDKLYSILERNFSTNIKPDSFSINLNTIKDKYYLINIYSSDIISYYDNVNYQINYLYKDGIVYFNKNDNEIISINKDFGKVIYLRKDNFFEESLDYFKNISIPDINLFKNNDFEEFKKIYNELMEYKIIFNAVGVRTLYKDTVKKVLNRSVDNNLEIIDYDENANIIICDYFNSNTNDSGTLVFNIDNCSFLIYKNILMVNCLAYILIENELSKKLKEFINNKEDSYNDNGKKIYRIWS